MTQTDDLLKEISQKLNVLIAMQMVEEKPKNIRDKIRLLHELGASTSDIAAILNISPNHAAKERSLLKKKMEQKQFETLCKKLDKIAALLVVQSIADKDDKIYQLKKMSLTSDEISPLVGVKNVRDTKGWKRK